MSQMQSFKELRIKAKNILEEHYKDKNQKRLAHIYGVAEMAEFLANRYGIDPDMAYIAGLMHDYSKYDNFDELKYLLSDRDNKECEKYPFLYHAYLSAIFFKKLVIDNDLIYNAIRYHVFGRVNMNMLEAIIMISDFTEKNRTYPDCIRCRKILVEDNDIDLAIYESLLATKRHCLEEGNEIHPEQANVLEEYEEKIRSRK